VKIYTRTGDDGSTALFGGDRVEKAHRRVRAYGAVDAANSAVGVAAAVASDDELAPRFVRIMSDLFDVGAELATPPKAAEKLDARLDTAVGSARISELEAWIDEAEAHLAPLTTFVLPTGTALAAHLHVARTAVRAAEREVVSLRADAPVREELLRYLNRLSDLLFVWARYANWKADTPDVPWEARKAPEDG
jgi:cob(I)alamin adenosyltransferase